MNKYCYLFTFSIALLLLLSISTQTSLSLQEAPPRSPDLIRELYESNPLYHQLPLDSKLPLSSPSVATPSTWPPPSWSRLAFESFRSNNWDIYLVNPDGSGEMPLVANKAIDAYPALKHGSEQMLFASDRTGNFEIYIINTNGSGLLRLTNDPANDIMPAWSRDGTHIAFQSYRTGNSDIFVMDADGSHVVQLTNSGEYDGHPSWSPDGTQIVFSSKRTGRYELWVMDANGANQRQLTNGATALYPAWSPNGDKIAYANDSDNNGWLEIWQINPDGSSPERLYAYGYNADTWMPSWSPDGKWLAFVQTNWIMYEEQWYWTSSYLILQEIGTSVPQYILYGHDDRVWRVHWASTDMAPPSACTINVSPQQTWSSFIVSWSAQDVGSSGLAAYDVQARISATAPWQALASNTSLTAIIYQAHDNQYVEFRCRARDVAGNVADWAGAPVASTTLDAEKPESQVLSPPKYVRGTSVPVSWSGQDAGSGIANYDVLVRKGLGGDWQLWQNDVTTTMASFAGEAGHTYYFRSQARDNVGHLEPWQPRPQAQVTFYSHVLSITVKDNRGNTGLTPVIELTPAALYTKTNYSSGLHELYLGTSGAYTLAISAAGHGRLPFTTLSITQDSIFESVIPPSETILRNGNFETGTLADWSILGNGAQVTSSHQHTGNYALQISHTTSDTTWLTQTIAVSATLHKPTLSFLYDIPTDLEGQFSVMAASPITPTLFYTLFHASQSTSGWTHAWADLSAYANQNIILLFQLAQTTGTVELDEISVGAWRTPLVEAVSPMTWPGYQTATLTITGNNFIATPAVYLNHTLLSNVTWISATRLVATAPQGLAPGTYDLQVVNSNNVASTLPAAVKITWHQVFLPATLRNAGRDKNIIGGPNSADWTTLGYDAAHTGYNRADPGGSRYAQAWVTTVPFPEGRPLEQVAVADGVLVASSDSYFGEAGVVALNAETGQELWRLPFSQKYSINPPSIAHGAVYFQEGHHGSDSYLFCVDLYTGARYWQAPFGAQWETYLAPLIVGTAVYMNGGYYSGLYGFNAANGAELWHVSTEQIADWTPAYADDKLYTWIGNHFRAHAPATGDVLWHTTLNTAGFRTAPVITDQTAIVGGAGGLAALDLNTHLVRWLIEGNHDTTIPAVADNIVYALNNGTLEAHRLSDGTLLWSFEGDHQLAHAPVIAGNYVYVASNANTYVLNRTTHELKWQTGHGGWLTVANGFLYIAQPDKTIYAYRAQEP